MIPPHDQADLKSTNAPYSHPHLNAAPASSAVTKMSLSHERFLRSGDGYHAGQDFLNAVAAPANRVKVSSWAALRFAQGLKQARSAKALKLPQISAT